jgi:hypothetical protein
MEKSVPMSNSTFNLINSQRKLLIFNYFKARSHFTSFQGSIPLPVQQQPVEPEVPKIVTKERPHVIAIFII